MDYGNALLYGSTQSDLQRLQRIQNWAAKRINCALKKDHATPYLRELHWLPVRERITFKILVYVYKCIHGLAPPYLTSLLCLHCPAQPASDTTRLFQHNTIRSLQTASNQTFSIAAPQIWNSLAISFKNSPSLDTFKKALKHKLFPIKCVFVHIFCCFHDVSPGFFIDVVFPPRFVLDVEAWSFTKCYYVCMYVNLLVSYDVQQILLSAEEFFIFLIHYMGYLLKITCSKTFLFT